MNNMEKEKLKKKSLSMQAWTVESASDDRIMSGYSQKIRDDYTEIGDEYGENEGADEDEEEGLGIQPIDGIPFYQRVKPIYYFYLAFGLDIRDGTNNSRKVLMYSLRFLTMIMELFTMSWYWIETFLTLKEEYLEYGSVLANLIMATQVTTSCITHTILHTRIDKLIALLRKLDGVNSTSGINKKDLKMVALCAGVGVLYLFLYTALPVTWTVAPDFIPEKLNQTILQSNSYYVQQLTVTVLTSFPMRIVTIIVVVFDMMSMIFFLLFAQRFFTVFRDSKFVKSLEAEVKPSVSKILQDFRKNHFTICGVVEEIDAVYAPMVLIWYILFTLAMCCWIRAFNTGAFGQVDGMFMVMLSLIVSFVQFFLLSYATSTINDEVTAHLDTVRVMCINEDCSKSASMHAVQERISHLSYVTCVLASPVALTGWGFFCISKGFVLTVSSTVLTFTLVLYGV